MDKNELIELFRDTFPFWDQLNEEDKETFCRSSHHVNFPKGTNIHDGNECTGVILIKSGSLRLYMLSEEGKELCARQVAKVILDASADITEVTEAYGVAEEAAGAPVIFEDQGEKI